MRNFGVNQVRYRIKGEMPSKISSDATVVSLSVNSDVDKKTNLSSSQLHYGWSPLFIGLWLLLYYLTTLTFYALPHAVQINETEEGNKFIAERALNDLRDLTNIGPRVVGSPQNEKAAIQFFIEKIAALRKQMNNDMWHLEEDIQVVSDTNVVYNSVNIYQGIHNYVVKLSPKQSNSNSSLLINSHFDSVPGSPGAADDGTMVVVMIEVLRIIAKSSEPLQHSIVFLFNGAEENTFLGSHGFIMNHKWASSVKAYINLDSAGNGGREILFQSAARRGLWLMKYYKDNAVHPYTNTLYEELFQNGYIPSETDFKIFRDYKYLPGLDLAQAYNGYVYHTKFDRFEIISPGSIQNTGDNLLAIAKGLANASELQNPTDQKEGHAVFFDFINLFVIFYSEDVGLIINMFTVVITLLLIVTSLWCMSRNSEVSIRGVIGRFITTFIIQILSIILSTGFLFALAFILDLCKLTLSWFSQPWLIFGLYFCPFYFVLSVIPAIYLYITRKNALPFNYRVQLFLHCQGVFLVIILLFMISHNIRSAYIFMIALLFYDISLLVNLVSTMHNKEFKWIIFHLISQLLPVIFFSSLSYTFYTSLVPMQGRSKSYNNPEILIAAASVIFALLIGGFLIPLISIFRKSTLIACSFLAFAFIFIIIIVTPIGFPYTAETAPQRIEVFHTKRIFHDVDQSIKYSDSGYFLLPSDRNIWTITDYIFNGSQIPKRKDYCKDYFNCGMPTFDFPGNNAFWKPSGEPNLDKSFKLELISKEIMRDNISRFVFNLNGPDVMKMLISPMKEVKLLNWSFRSELEKLQSPYFFFVMFCSTTDNSSFTFTLDFEMGSRYQGLKITSGRSKLHYAWAPLFIGVWLLLYFITTLAFHSLPHPIKINEVGDGRHFIAERALKDLLDLTKIGPRVVGSPANEQVAMKFLIERVDAIRQLMNIDLFLMETDVQIASGSYVLEKSVNMYQAIQNYVVKLSWKHSNSSSSLLINSHFDTVPGSPGAGDDGTMVVVMIEILRILAQSSEPLQHSIVFLFNGAEENPLQGSHAFITQHKWASNVKAFINLDSAGNGGREVLFQSGPNHPWLMQYYKDNAVHPFANTMAEELFQKGFIPSDTDFRIFRDYGRIPGLDFAHSYNDYVYHTKYDRFEIVPPGTIQNTGDNILAMARALSNAPELLNPMAQDEGQTIFFDFVNIFLIVYPDHVGLIINISISVIALVLISISLWWMSDNSGVTLVGVLGRFAITFLLQIASIILAACLSIALAFIFDLSNLSLSWFSQPWLIFGLYFCPFYFVLSIIPAVYLHVTRENALLLNHRVQLFLHAQAIYLIIILLVLTFLNIRSAYVIMIAVFFYDISLTINLVSTMHNKQLLWILPHLISQILPVVFFAYLSYQFYTSFIPMQGRAGSGNNPELLICGASILFGLLIGGFLVPLISIFRKSALIACSFLLVAFIFIIVTVTPIGFPYTAETAPQRLQIFHTKRLFHDVDQSVKSSDSGFFILPADRNIWTIPDYILNASQIRKKDEFCHDSFNCGVPVYNFRRSQLSNNMIWVPAGEPNLIKKPNFELLSKEPKRDNVIRYTFSLNGPDHMTILISPMSEIKLVNWSFTEIPFQSWGSPYFVSFSYAIDPNPFKFSLDFQTPPHWNGSVFNIAVTGHLTHHRIQYTPEFKEFLTTFPSWTYPSGWMSSVEHWIM